MDVTKDELVAALRDGPVKDYWTAAADFPATALPAEFLSSTLTAAWRAATTKNQGQQAGSLIAAYPAPTYGGLSIDPATGLETAVKTTSVVVRIPSNPDMAVAEMQ